MPLLGRAKQRIGERLGSGATAGEGAQNLLCAYMAAGVLVGLAANAALGWWWLDPVIALVIAAIAVREGREAWAGEGCACARSPASRPTAARTAAADGPRPPARSCDGHAGHSHGVSADADRGKLAIALGLILGFMAVEVTVGILASSLALLSDAAHMLTDAIAIGLSLVAIRLAQRPAKGAMTFGLKRTEILSALYRAGLAQAGVPRRRLAATSTRESGVRSAWSGPVGSRLGRRPGVHPRGNRVVGCRRGRGRRWRRR